MTEQQLQPTGTKVIVSGELVALAWEARWALRLMCILSFVDIAMLLHFKCGVLQFGVVYSKILNDLGWAAVSVGLYALLAVVIVPMTLLGCLRVLAIIQVLSFGGSKWLAVIVMGAGLWASISLSSPNIWSTGILIVLAVCLGQVILRGDRASAHPDGYVRLDVLHAEAIKRQDTFLLQNYEMKKQDVLDERSQRTEAVSLLALLTMGVFTDWIMQAKVKEGHGLVETGLRFLSISAPAPDYAWSHLLLFNALVVVMAACLSWHLFDPKRTELVYFPLLHKNAKMTSAQKTA